MTKNAAPVDTGTALMFYGHATTQTIRTYNMEMTRVNVTPSMAGTWLETLNENNRSISRGKVNVYAAEITDGTWRNTHQNCIAFYEDGILADGQHRLSAVVQAKKPVEMFVATGLSRVDGAAIDQGRARKLTDALVIGGMVESSKYISAQVAILRMVRHAETADIRAMTATATAEKIAEMSDGIYFATENTGAAKSGVGNAAVRGAVAVAFYQIPAFKLQRFCRVLVTGMPEGPEDMMIIRVRNWLMEGQISATPRNKLEAYRIVLHFIKTYNAGHDLKRVSKLAKNPWELGIFNND
jgi:hypothetical protein